MKTLIKALIIVPLAFVVILLSVANRASVVVSLDPFSGSAPLIAISAPLFVIILGAVALGVLLGGFVVWWSQGRYRRALRQQTHELERLKVDLARQHSAAGYAARGSIGGSALLPLRTNAY